MTPKRKQIRITLIRSVIGRLPKQRRTIRALGLRRLNQTVEHLPTPSLDGMIRVVRHLIRVEE